MKITATIITLNEERNIARAIESLRCCDQIVCWTADRWIARGAGVEAGRSGPGGFVARLCESEESRRRAG